jgi:uncharacterized membrane protein
MVSSLYEWMHREVINHRSREIGQKPNFHKQQGLLYDVILISHQLVIITVVITVITVVITVITVVITVVISVITVITVIITVVVALERSIVVSIQQKL